MDKEEEKSLVPVEIIQGKIYLIRSHKVMLDRDLAELYGVLTKQLTRQVRRNLGRFPDDFMFRLTTEEYDSLRSQFGTLKRGQHDKKFILVFEAIKRLLEKKEEPVKPKGPMGFIVHK